MLNIGDKVGIKTINKYGTIVGWTYKNCAYTYMVRYRAGNLFYDSGFFGIHDCLGFQYLTEVFTENELINLKEYIKENLSINMVETYDICNHKWKTYNGFTEKYDYCELCDKRRE